MNISGYGFKEHIRFLVPFFAFIAAVWALRMVLGALQAPHWLLHLVSVTAAVSLAVLLATLLIHFRNFGSYSNVVFVTFLLVVWGQGLVTLAILYSVGTGMGNIYTAPEFSLSGPDPGHVRHMVGHFTQGVGAGTLFGSAMGCLILFLLRRLAPVEEKAG